MAIKYVEPTRLTYEPSEDLYSEMLKRKQSEANYQLREPQFKDGTVQDAPTSLRYQPPSDAEIEQAYMKGNTPQLDSIPTREKHGDIAPTNKSQSVSSEELNKAIEQDKFNEFRKQYSGLSDRMAQFLYDMKNNQPIQEKDERDWVQRALDTQANETEKWKKQNALELGYAINEDKLKEKGLDFERFKQLATNINPYMLEQLHNDGYFKPVYQPPKVAPQPTYYAPSYSEPTYNLPAYEAVPQQAYSQQAESVRPALMGLKDKPMSEQLIELARESRGGGMD